MVVATRLVVLEVDAIRVWVEPGAGSWEVEGFFLVVERRCSGVRPTALEEMGWVGGSILV